jgi:hypothetical protein
MQLFVAAMGKNMKFQFVGADDFLSLAYNPRYLRNRPNLEHVKTTIALL